MLTDKQLLGPGVTDITLLLDILPAGKTKNGMSPALARILSYNDLSELHLLCTPRCMTFDMPAPHLIQTRGFTSRSTIVVGFCAPKLRPKYDSSGSLTSVSFHRPDTGTERFSATAGRWGPGTSIIEWAQSVFVDSRSAKILWPRALAFVCASLIDEKAKNPCLLVTNDRTLLEHQPEIQRLFYGKPIRIVTESEALRILDLHQKQLNHYLLRPNCHILHNRFGWYWSAAQADLPNVPEESTLVRAMHARYAVDSLGAAYYGNIDSSDTEESTYHFDYLLLLLTAVLDETALQVRECYTPDFDEHRVTMRPPRNRSDKNQTRFYRGVSDANPKLEELWTKSAAFLQLLYSLRNAPAHRKVLKQFTVKCFRKDSWQRIIVVDLSNWTSDTEKTSKSMFEAVADISIDSEPCSSLGVLPMGQLQQLQPGPKYTLLLEPYHFGVAAWARVRYLLNESARLIGSPVQIQETTDGKDWGINWTRTFMDQALEGLQLNVPEIELCQK